MRLIRGTPIRIANVRICRRRDAVSAKMTSAKVYIASETSGRVASLQEALSKTGQSSEVEWCSDGDSGFDTALFFQKLQTRKCGQTLLHAAQLTSTQELLKSRQTTLIDGVACVALKQSAGRGRGSNQWESPIGCLMFSVYSQLSIDPASSPFMNYVVCIAIVRAVKRLTRQALQGEEVDIKIKWPNDIYYRDQKIGGVLLHSTFRGAVMHLITGIGLNVRNDRPTTCLQSIVQNALKVDPSSVEPLKLECVMAEILNDFEPLLEVMAERGFAPLEQEYLSYWMHSDQQLTLDSGVAVNIRGVAPNGYLLAETEDGATVELMPEGTSVDLLGGLVIRRR